MDYIAGFLELMASYLLGEKKKIGFLLNVVGAMLWIAIAIDYEIYGLLLVVVPAVVINFSNYFKWGKHDIYRKR